MEEETERRLEDHSKHWKIVLWRKFQLTRFGEVALIVLVGGLITWLLTYAFFHQIDRFTYGDQSPTEATPAYVKQRFAELILEPYDSFEMHFYHPNLKVWSFNYRPRFPLSFEPLVAYSKDRGWRVTQAKPQDLHLEKITGDQLRLISRIYLRKSANAFEVWVADAGKRENDNQYWSRIDALLSATSQPRSTY